MGTALAELLRPTLAGGEDCVKMGSRHALLPAISTARQFSFPRPVAGVGLESDRVAKTCVAIRGAEAPYLPNRCELAPIALASQWVPDGEDCLSPI